MVSSADLLHRKAEGLYAAGKADEALIVLGQAAQAGSLAAMTELGARLVVAAGAPRAPADGVNFLRFAANAGFALAARYLAILAGTGHAVAQDWDVAVEWLQKAGDAEAELDLLASRTRQDWLAPPPVRLLSESPRIGVIEGFMPPALCAGLIAAAEGRMSAAGVTDSQTGAFAADPARTNSFAQIRLFDFPLPLAFLREQIASVVSQPTAHFEVMNILNYDTGQRYEEHHDYLDPAKAGFREELACRGQRVATFLVYLNDDFEDGETAFPDPDLSFRGRTGDALFFMNVSPEGAIEPSTRHAGLPPTRGRKWLLSQWVRDREQILF